MRSTYKRLLAILGVAGLLALPAAPALAEDPVTIPSGQNIVDSGNVLGNRKGEVQDAIQKLLKDHKYNLYVITAKTFENPTDPKAWAQAVATTKGMGKADVILTMSDDGKYYFAPYSTSAIASKTSNITQNAIVPNLAGGKRDFAQAAIDTATAVGDAAGGGSGAVSSG
ncbi:TPM domain-containing protein, partial [Arthrobacter sp. SO3]|uniref:TPM domain-containing protein n=1 Tax=Arthrobacter sp. SO3 TaxID=1897057 RepID=UPI001CFFDAFB